MSPPLLDRFEQYTYHLVLFCISLQLANVGHWPLGSGTAGLTSFRTDTEISFSQEKNRNIMEILSRKATSYLQPSSCIDNIVCIKHHGGLT